MRATDHSTAPTYGLKTPRVSTCPPPSKETGDKASEESTTPIRADSLRVGMCLEHDILDHSGVVLLAGGTHVTTRFLALLNQRDGVTFLRAPSPPIETGLPVGKGFQELDKLLTEDLARCAMVSDEEGARRSRLPNDELRSRAAQGLDTHATTGERLADVCSALQRGDCANAHSLQECIREFVNMLSIDADLLPTIVSAQESQDEYLFDHWVNVALLSMSVGVRLGLNQGQLTELGLGALLQDLGMLRVPGEIRNADRKLTPEEWVEIKRHPSHTLEWLQRVPSLPVAAQFIAYQVHERADGSGYPRQRSGMFVHPYAKIVGLVDTYAAMTRPRPHRHSVMPYEAAKTLLVDASRNKFDRTIVRAFLDSVSLFPIGSLLELSDGSRAQALRSNAGLHTRPVVELVDPDGALTGRVIDLATVPDLKVVRAFSSRPD